jgi:uncharacterized protein
MKRNIDKHLLYWKQDKNRKALLLRGARQVGKTYSVRQLGKTFKYFIEINFELDEDVKYFFENSINPQDLIEKISAYYQIPVKNGQTLLFFDEIQECTEAIKSLRFFYEKMPELHVIAAGSLLEFALSEISSYGVGRIETLFMYPLNFLEFLRAMNENSLVEIIENSNFNKPIDLPFFNRLKDFLKTFLLIGGMPEVVSNYINNRNLQTCQKIISNLILTFKDDFLKYRKRTPVECLSEVFNSIAFQTGSKFIYSNVNTSSTYKTMQNALDMLVMAGLAYKVYHTSASGIPLGAQINQKKFKVLIFDIGIFHQITGLDISPILTAENVNALNKGNIAELFTGLEIIKNSNSQMPYNLYYWHRESKSSNAEIDYIIQLNNSILPIEVKAGTKGQMQSMHIFLDEKKIDFGLRISLENFSEYEKIKTVPLFAIANLFKI